MTSHYPLILSSGSSYRRELLTRLGLPFSVISPDIDETPLAGESVANLVTRLALAKVRAVAATLSEAAIVIGSDQVAALGNTLLTKPGGFEVAQQQLLNCSGQRVVFYTSLAVLRSPDSEAAHQSTVTTTIQFRTLTHQQIDVYLRREQPYDCAGSFKMEGLGISLFEWVRSDDPTALIGLPLINLVSALRDLGLDPLK